MQFVENTPNAARTILSRRMSLTNYLSDREILWHEPTNSIALHPRFTWGELNAALGTNMAPKAPPFKLVVDIEHFFPSNGKMVCPTWSIAPGPVEYGGNCIASDAMFALGEIEYIAGGGPAFAGIQAAVRGQRIAALGAYGKGDPADWVCNDCYALKANFQIPSKIVKWVMLEMWMKRVPDFAASMINMIRLNRERLLAGAEGYDRRAMGSGTWPHPDYFRVHDAGDFYSVRYFESWCEIASALPEIKFWAATRAWAVPELARAFSRIPCPPNLIIRPSELFKNQAPMRHRWPPAAATMVASADAALPRGAIVCPAGATEAGSCQNSGRRVRYPGRRKGLAWAGGCRACWDAPELPIVYMEH